MKRWLIPILLLCLFLPGGCAAVRQSEDRTEPAAPVIEMTPPVFDTTLPPAAESPDSAQHPDTEPVQTEPEDSAADSEAPATAVPVTEPPETPIPYQDGDTTPTWHPETAEDYPADTDCSADQLLQKWMAVEGLTAADLDARGCDQLILTAAQPTDGVQTVTVCYERGPDGRFVQAESLPRMYGHVGRNGIMHDRRRNTYTSPAGLWAISSAFGNELPPDGLKLPWRQVTPNSDWVCDEESPYFNTWQERGDPALKPWSDDVEHLENYPVHYAWACVIEFNRPPDVVPKRGCAIFLHVSDGGTGGCVGLSRADLLAVLNWLDASRNPYILITGAQIGN